VGVLRKAPLILKPIEKIQQEGGFMKRATQKSVNTGPIRGPQQTPLLRIIELSTPQQNRPLPGTRYLEDASAHFLFAAAGSAGISAVLSCPKLVRHGADGSGSALRKSF
jgi:hypothetical protein